MNKLVQLLLQPYPFNDVVLDNPFRAFRGLLNWVLQGVFVAAFLQIFQPFGLSYWNNPNKFLYIVGFGAITTLSLLILNFVITRIFPSYFNEQSWTVGREICKTLLLLFLITVGNFLFASFTFINGFSFKNLVWSFGTVMLIGVFPISFGVLMNYIYQLKKYQAPINVKHKEKTTKLNVLRFVAENEKDVFEILENELLFIESADNYAVIYFEKESKIQKELLRSSLTRLESQIQTDDVVRCHRSFIVNLNKVKNVTGNAQGYKFYLNSPEIIVPVARKYADLVERIS